MFGKVRAKGESKTLGHVIDAELPPWWLSDCGACVIEREYACSSIGLTGRILTETHRETLVVIHRPPTDSRNFRAIDDPCASTAFISGCICVILVGTSPVVAVFVAT